MTHTPSTHEVRIAWAEFDGYVSTVFQYTDGARAEFDRWLNEVKGAAWEEGALAGYDDCEFGREKMRNPYRTAD